MTNTCPNCSHSVRTGAKFCGFCGIDLVSFTTSNPTTAATAEGSALSADAKTLPTDASSHRDIWRLIAVIAIVLLVIVIVSALFIQYWGVILPLLVQFISRISN